MRSILLIVGHLLAGLLLAAPASGSLVAGDVFCARDQGEGVEEGRALLRSLEEKHRERRFLEARYVQERTTPLVRRPLLSEGLLLFRREPGCLVFYTQKPKESILRLDEEKYEVYRPDRHNLERFRLTDQKWQLALFQTFAHQVEDIEKDFEILASTLVVPEPTETGADESYRSVRFAPRSQSTAEKIRDLEIGIRLRDSLIVKVAYTDQNGDHIAITLSDLQPDQEIAAERFALVLPPGTQVLEH